MKKLLLLFYAIILVFTATTNCLGAENEYRFTENKNQWHKSIKYRTEIDGGYLYLRNKGFTFDFYDSKKVNQLIGHHGNSETENHSHASKGSKSRIQKNEDELILKKNTIDCHLYNVNFLGANSNAQIETVNTAPYYSNYFRGKNKNSWASNVKSFSNIVYNNIYPNINLNVYYKNGNHKYDFIVAPNSNPNLIKLEYEGVNSLKIEYGNLYIQTSVNQVIEQKPYAYQIIAGLQKAVACNYKLTDSVLSFEFPNGYNTNYELIIDPTLIFSTYSGSRSNNFGYTATYDNDGFLYAGSTSFSAWGLTQADLNNGQPFTPIELDTSFYPITPGAYQVTFGGGVGLQGSNFTFGVDIAITKFDSSGTSIIYSTYLGGSADELPHSLIVNAKKELYIYGTTGSLNFPVTPNAFDTTFNGGTPLDLTNGIAVNFLGGTDMFVSKLDANGANLLASTYIGGSNNDGMNDSPNKLAYNYADEVRGEVSLDNNEDVYIVSSTNSTDIPIFNTGPNSIQGVFGGGNQDGCIFKLTPDLSTIIWSTYLGGTDDDAIYSIAHDTANNIYVSGGTVSTNFPTTNLPTNQTYLASSFQGGRSDGFITHITANGTNIINSKYFGSPAYDQSYFVETDGFNHVYLFGQTRASGSTLVFNAGFSNPNSGQFITKMESTLDTIIWSTVFGNGDGRVNISPTAFLVDICDRLYIAGWGGTTNNSHNNETGFTIRMPITADAFQPVSVDSSDFYLMALRDDASQVDYGSYFGSPISSDHVDGGTSRFDKKGKIYQAVCASCGPDVNRFPTFPNNAHSTTDNSNFGQVIESGQPLRISGCNLGVFKFDFDLPLILADFNTTTPLCLGNANQFTNTSFNAVNYEWSFGDATTSTQINPNHLYGSASTFNVKLKATNNGTCNIADSITKQVTIVAPTNTALQDTSICLGDNVQIPINSQVGTIYDWNNGNSLSNSTIANPIATPTQNTNYLLLATSLCPDTFTQNIEVIDLKLEVNKDTLLCGNLDSIHLLSNSFGTATNFIWSNSLSFLDTLNNVPDSTVSILLNTGRVFYNKISKKHCFLIDSVKGSVSNLSITITAPSLICVNDTLLLTAQNQNLLDTISFSWSPTATIISDPDSSNILAKPLQNTTYILNSVNQKNCNQIDTIRVDVSQLPLLSVTANTSEDTLAKGLSANLSALPSGYTYSWLPGSSLNNNALQNPVASPTNNTNYILQVTDRGMCLKTDSVMIYVFEVICGEPNVFIANAFTPNNDLNNDMVYVRGNFLQDFKLEIFNRWGEKVFETTDKSIGWDGYYKGQLAEPAVYDYYFTTICVDGQKFFKKGNITLIR